MKAFGDAIFIFIFLTCFHFSMKASAQEIRDATEIHAHFKKSCYCETGNWPKDQKKLFEIGCAVWLARQSGCNLKEIVDEDIDYTQKDIPKNTKLLSVGYVGHWDNSKHFIDYLDNSILPVMRAKSISADVDNTACDAMHDPERVFDYLKTQSFAPDQFLKARGNQAISIGTWDVILPSDLNFIAEVSSRVNHVIYPSCGDYEHYACLQQYQLHESGKCVEDDAGDLRQLVCCQVKLDPYEHPYQMRYQWEQRQNCEDLSLSQSGFKFFGGLNEGF